MNYSKALATHNSVTSVRGNGDTFHVTTPLIESPGVAKLCVQTSLRTINKQKESILERLERTLKTRNISLSEDTYSVDLTTNRLVLCFKKVQHAENLVNNQVPVGNGEHLSFCVNEPKLWVITIFKVPGYYDANSHQYLRSFASNFGVVHRIYRKTVTSNGKSYGGPNIIVQYSSLFSLPPKRILLDGKHNLEVYWTKPSKDMFHTTHAPAENHPEVVETPPSESESSARLTITVGEDDRRKIQYDKIDPSPCVVTNMEPMRTTVPETPATNSETQMETDSFRVVRKNKHGRMISTPVYSSPAESLSGVEEGDELFESFEVHESEGEEIDPLKKYNDSIDFTDWGETPEPPRESQPISEYPSSEGKKKKDVPTNRRTKVFKKKSLNMRKNVNTAKEKRAEGANSAMTFLTELRQIKLKTPMGITAEEAAKTKPKTLNSSSTLEDERKNKLSPGLEESRKRQKEDSPKREGFKIKTKEPLKKKATVEANSFEANGNIVINRVSLKVESLGPINWLLATGNSIVPWGRLIMAKIIEKGFNPSKVKGLPLELRSMATDVRCNKPNVKGCLKVLEESKNQKTCKEALELAKKHKKLFEKNI